MKNATSSSHTNEDYNSVVVPIALISVLIIIRICINKYQKQNIIIAWVNFLSFAYILWRIYFRTHSVLKNRKGGSQVFKNQLRSFHRFSRIIIFILIIFMIIYSFALSLLSNFYPYGSCINDILSLLALLFSIEDEKITNKLINYYRMKV